MFFLFISVDAFPSWNWELLWAKSIPQSHKLEVVQSFLSPVVRFFLRFIRAPSVTSGDRLPALRVTSNAASFHECLVKGGQPAVDFHRFHQRQSRSSVWRCGTCWTVIGRKFHRFIYHHCCGCFAHLQHQKQCKHCLAVWCSLQITCFWCVLPILS